MISFCFIPDVKIAISGYVVALQCFCFVEANQYFLLFVLI